MKLPGNLLPCEDASDVLNKAILQTLHTDEKGKRHAWVCTTCDKIMSGKSLITLQHLKKHKNLLSHKRELPSDVVKFYTYKATGKKRTFTTGMLLSNRASYIPVNPRKFSPQDALSCCAICKNSLSQGYTPVNAICNGNEIGPVPVELSDLTRIELSFISPVRMHGNIFSYFGGPKGIKG